MDEDNKDNVDGIVIVIDVGNYKKSYAEEIPFKAKVIRRYDACVLVQSLITDKEYELYFYQTIEGLEIEEIKEILKL